MRSDQRGGIEAGEHIPPCGPGSVEVSIGQPGNESAIRHRGGQLLTIVGREDLAQQDGQRPAIKHDVVVGEHEAVVPGCGAQQCRPKERWVGQVAHRGAFLGAHPSYPIVGVGGAIEVDRSPRRRRIDGDDLHRRVELRTEPRRQVGMAHDDGVYRLAESNFIERAGKADDQLGRIRVDTAVLGDGGVEQQALLQRRQRQHVGDTVAIREVVDLALGEASGQQIRRSESAPTASHMGADPGQGVKPQLA
ncbi:hypothetical protein MYSI104531_27270 [Mycobacterium simiae]